MLDGFVRISGNGTVHVICVLFALPWRAHKLPCKERALHDAGSGHQLHVPGWTRMKIRGEQAALCCRAVFAIVHVVGDMKAWRSGGGKELPNMEASVLVLWMVALHNAPSSALTVL